MADAMVESFAGLLGAKTTERGSIALSDITLDDVAFYDFAFHEYFLPTEHGYLSFGRGLSEAALGYLDDLQRLGASDKELAVLAAFLVAFEDQLVHAVANSLPPHMVRPTLQLLTASLYRNHRDLLERILTYYLEQLERGRGEQVLTDLYRLLRIHFRFLWSYARDVQDPNWWQRWDDAQWKSYIEAQRPRQNVSTTFEEQWAEFSDVSAGYGFEVFPSHSVNVGLRLIYRQQWKLLGMQPGEIVRTVPLGPGQKERVSVKVVRRKKLTSTQESVEATESTTESGQTSKDSSELVKEAANSSNWKVDASVSGSFLVSASVSTSVGGTAEDKTRETSSSLTESMSKAATKVRKETKVVVSTEREETFETEQVSEIANPNNDIAVTYEYHTLQQQYEVFTALAEVQSVVLVAEYVPPPAEIDAAWVRRHDWIISRVLIDESFRATLNELIQDADVEDPEAGPDDPFRAMLNAATDKFSTFTTNSSSTNSPTSGGLSLPDIYAEPLRVYQERLRERMERERARLVRKTRRERLLDHLREHVLHYCRAIWMEEDHDQRMLRYKKENRRIPVEWRMDLNTGRYVPTGQDRPLVDLVEPTGPIGYVGNYAVFALRPLPGDEGPADQQDDQAPLRRLDVGLGAAAVPTPGVPAAHVVPTIDLATLFWIARAPYVSSGELVDPALVQARRRARAQTQISQEQLEDVASYLPRLRQRLRDQNGELDHTLVTANDPITADEWAEYLYRRELTRRFLVDSNNLYLSIRVGEGEVLEPFKRAHRYVDVRKAAEDLEASRLKNQRRAALLGDAGTFDPDIEKVVILNGPSGTISAGAVATTEAETTSSTSSTLASAPTSGPPADGDSSTPPS